MMFDRWRRFERAAFDNLDTRQRLLSLLHTHSYQPSTTLFYHFF